MPFPGFPCGHVAQICEEFLKFWLSDEHGKVQPCKLASVSWCELSNESFNEPFFVNIYFVYWFAIPAQKWATLCQDTGTLRQSKLTAATSESIMVTHAQAMSIQLQLNKKLANVIQGCAIQCEKHQKSFQLKSMSRRFSRHQATELDLQNLDHHVVALPMASIQHLNLVLIILDRKTAWAILSFETICIFRLLTHENMYQVKMISWSTCLMVQSAHES